MGIDRAQLAKLATNALGRGRLCRLERDEITARELPHESSSAHYEHSRRLAGVGPGYATQADRCSEWVRRAEFRASARHTAGVRNLLCLTSSSVMGLRSV